MRWRYFIPLIVSLAISFGCAPQGIQPSPVSGQAKQIIEIKAVDQILNYQRQSFWSEEKFSELSKDNLIAKFKDEHEVDAREFEVCFDEANRSTITRCCIYGTVSKSGNSYRTGFEWLLNPLGLDFIVDDFEKSKKGLSWEGWIDDTPTIIRLEFPAAIDNCHKHVWWTVSYSEKTKQIVEVRVVDQTVLYQCQSFWSAEKFSEVSENDLAARFKAKYDVDAREFEFSFEPANHSTVTKCNIYGVIMKSRDRYTADFLWLLKPLGLDFIGNDFEESNQGLSWEGCVNGVAMSIEVKCPPQGCVYEAWQYPVGHCHGHIWWPVSSY